LYRTRPANPLLIEFRRALRQRSVLEGPCRDAQPPGLSDRDGALAIEEIEAIVRDFESLCPYISGGSLFKVEGENFHVAEPARRIPLYARVVSAKRYALLSPGPDGEWVIRRFSEHGLGSYLDPGDGSGAWVDQ
jgi:hypothetical protein